MNLSLRAPFSVRNEPGELVPLGWMAIEDAHVPQEMPKRAQATGSVQKDKDLVAEVWDLAELFWDRSRLELQVTWQGGKKRAATRDRQLIPGPLREPLMEKRKRVKARVKVAVDGPQLFRITEISILP